VLKEQTLRHNLTIFKTKNTGKDFSEKQKFEKETPCLIAY